MAFVGICGKLNGTSFRAHRIKGKYVNLVVKKFEVEFHSKRFAERLHGWLSPSKDSCLSTMSWTVAKIEKN